MKRRYCTIVLSVFLILSLLFASAALAEENGQGTEGSTVTGETYGETGNDTTTNEGGTDQTTTEESTTEEEVTEDILNEPDDNSAVETEEPESSLESEDPATDIAPEDVGQGQLPDPQEGSWEDLTSLAEEVDRELAGAGPAVKLHAMIKRFNSTRNWGAPHLVAVSTKIKEFTKNHLRYINNHPRAERAIVLMTDETVRLAHHHVKNDRAKLIVYRNAAHIYSMLGCYKRAAGAMERALKLSPNRAAAYDNMKQLYKKTGAKGIKVLVRGQRPNFDVKPMVQNGRTLVPIRAITESLGARVNYDPKLQKVNINNGNINIDLNINNRRALVNGRSVDLDEPASIVNGRTMVPLRFISENLGTRVNWDGPSETITVE